MQPRRCRFAFLVAWLLVAGACGGSGDASDAGPPADARLLADAHRVACDLDADSCAQLAFETVCDPARSTCVECVSSSDCTGPDSLGPSCDSSDGSCRCDEDADCEGNHNGPRCLAEARACTCLIDDDCEPGFECRIEPYLGTRVRRCQPVAP